VRATVNSAGPDFLTDTTRTGYVGRPWEDGLTVNLDGRRKNGGKRVTGMIFCLLAKAWLTVARTAVPLGTVDEGGLLRRLAGDYLSGDRLG